MTPLLSTLVLVAPVMLVAVGVGLLSFTGLQTAASVVQGLRRRWDGRFMWLYDDDGATVEIGTRRWTFTWSMLLPLVGGLGLALLWRDLWLSGWSVVFGLAATTLIYLSEAPATAADRALEEVFLAAFRSRYAVTRSLGAALRGAAEDLDVSAEHALSQAVRRAVQRLYAGEDLKTALEPLAAHSPLLRRLTTILERSNLAAQDETQDLLVALEEQARHRRRAAERARVTLTVVRLTLQVLVIANATIIVGASLLATWRWYYLAHPLTYMVGSGLALAGYTYFRFKIKHLEERL